MKSRHPKPEGGQYKAQEKSGQSKSNQSKRVVIYLFGRIHIGHHLCSLPVSVGFVKGVKDKETYSSLLGRDK